MNPYEVRSVAESVIGEDRVPTICSEEPYCRINSASSLAAAGLTSKTEKIGTLDVPSGTLLVGDPCYKLSEDYAKDVDSHTAKAERLEARFRTERIGMIANFGDWIAGQPAGTDMSGFIAELLEMGTITAGARQSVAGFLGAVLDLRKQNISQPVNAATERLVAVLDRQIENLGAIERFCLSPVASVTP